MLFSPLLASFVFEGGRSLGGSGTLASEGRPQLCHLQNLNICGSLRAVPCRGTSLPEVTEQAADTQLVSGHIG